jgi:hypothetical protein
MIKDYNGWVNKETWNINLVFEELFRNMAEEQTYDDIDHMADSFEQIVSELEFDRLKEYTLAHTAVGEYLDRVSWAEIASHYFVEEEEEDVEEDNDSDYYTTVVD